MNPLKLIGGLLLVTTLVPLTGCPESQPNELDKLPTINMTLGNKQFRLWVAANDLERNRGLMFVTAEQMAPLPDGTERGMVFVFDHERYLSFWMRNTIIPLDIAYINSDGLIVATHTMAPLDTRYNQYPSGSPARYAIEVNAGVLSQAGVAKGDRITIPSDMPAGAP